MVTIYFSGTGNSQYIATRFSDLMGCLAFSIEEALDFCGLIEEQETIAFCYPIYGSCVPLIMREFVAKHKHDLDGKKLIIFSTQLLFSGDGARTFTDLLDGIRYTVLYAAHFNMPNNICNFALFPLAGEKRMAKYRENADRKIERICENIKNGIIRRRGFTIFSKALGLYSQRLYFQKYEERARHDIRVHSDCNLCMRCVRICPMKNLKLQDGIIEQNGHCTLCFRCVNQCPQKAITVLFHAKVKRQYPGFLSDMNDGANAKK